MAALARASRSGCSATASSAALLAEYASELGFTHVELMPVMEHPFYGSWGYQITGYFAPTARYGTPQDLMCADRPPAPARHRRDPRLGALALPQRRARPRLLRRHAPLRARRPAPGLPPRLEQLIFNYGRNEVRSFLLSRARSSGSTRYHADGLRVDAVASMLYLDYSRKAGRVDPERARRAREPRGDRVPAQVQRARSTPSSPGVQTIAEESTAWPMVSRPTYAGGLGFGFKWDMGWMHDTLAYLDARPDPPPVPPRRAHLPHALRRSPRTSCCRCRTTRSCTARARCSSKMPGDDWQKLREPAPALGYMYAPARQEAPVHGRRVRAVSRVEPRRAPRLAPARATRRTPGVRALGRPTSTASTASEPALHALRLRARGFRVGRRRRRRSRASLAFLRNGRPPGTSVLVACNFTPVPRDGYRLGVPSRRLLARGPEQRRRGLRRQRHRQPRAAWTRTASAPTADPQSLLLDLPPLGCLWPARQDGVVIRASGPGPAVPARRDLGRRGHELRALLRARRRASSSACSIARAPRWRRARSRLHERTDLRLARLPARRAPRPASTATASTAPTRRTRATASTRTSS